MVLAIYVEVSTLPAKYQGYAAEFVRCPCGTQFAHQFGRFADLHIGKTQGLQILVTGLEPVG